MIGRMEPNWSLLPPDLIQLISEKLSSISDFVRFRVVCTTWQIASSPRHCHLPHQFPWLIFPRRSNGEEAGLGSTLSMYDLTQSKTHTLKLPQIHGKKICATSHGWLVLEKEREVWLFNPITRDQISLPPLSARPNLFTGTQSECNYKVFSAANMYIGTPLERNYTVGALNYWDRFCIRKAILSSNPSMDPDCLVIALFRGSWETAFCKIGDQCWTILSVKEILPFEEDVADIGYHNGLFYAVNNIGYVRIYDIRNRCSKFFTPTFHEGHEKLIGLICIVEGGCDEHGLMILRQDHSYFSEYNPINTYDILILSDKKDKWLVAEQKQLNGNVFFLESWSNSHCISLPIVDLKLDECEGGCMCYISPEFELGVNDVGLGSCSIRLVGLDYVHKRTLGNHLGWFSWDEFLHYITPPHFLWLTPTLC